MLLIKLGWRNILRNKKRMLPAVLAIAVGLAAFIAMDALVVGMKENMIVNATNTFLGHGQIHAKGFKQTFEADNIIKDFKKTVSGLNSEENIKAYTIRTETVGMLSSALNVETVIIFGINPETEKNISQIETVITKGKFLEKSNQNGLLIGEELSRLLEANIGDRIVITVAQAKTGELSQELFRVSGIFKFSTKAMDAKIAFINLDTSRKLLGIGDNAHEVAFKFNKISDMDDPLLNFWSRYSDSGNEALPWSELLPGIKAAIAMSSFTTLIMGGLLFAIVALVVMNTLFMSLFERMQEFGILRAIGTRPFRMAAMILSEAGVLCLLGIAAGIVLGVSLTGIVSVTGIDYTGMEMGSITFREPIRPVLSLKQVVLFPVCVAFFTLLAAVFPAISAARLTPAEAMKKRD